MDRIQIIRELKALIRRLDVEADMLFYVADIVKTDAVKARESLNHAQRNAAVAALRELKA